MDYKIAYWCCLICLVITILASWNEYNKLSTKLTAATHAGQLAHNSCESCHA